jgi:hypothetical protein
MTNSIRLYFDALSTFEEAEKKASKIISIVCSVAEVLRLNPQRFFFSNSVPMPAEVVLGRTSVGDANQWPSANQIQEALMQCHEALENVQNAWRAIPGEDRKKLQVPPPGIFQRSHVPA